LAGCRQDAVERALDALGRPALHAQTLGFDHPATGDRLQFSSALPADFQAALAELRSLQALEVAMDNRAPPAARW
jgi:23S rRNA pseudouridine1911/1915/1917 synthase